MWKNHKDAFIIKSKINGLKKSIFYSYILFYNEISTIISLRSYQCLTRNKIWKSLLNVFPAIPALFKIGFFFRTMFKLTFQIPGPLYIPTMAICQKLSIPYPFKIFSNTSCCPTTTVLCDLIHHFSALSLCQ